VGGSKRVVATQNGCMFQGKVLHLFESSQNVLKPLQKPLKKAQTFETTQVRPSLSDLTTCLTSTISRLQGTKDKKLLYLVLTQLIWDKIDILQIYYKGKYKLFLKIDGYNIKIAKTIEIDLTILKLNIF